MGLQQLITTYLGPVEDRVADATTEPLAGGAITPPAPTEPISNTRMEQAMAAAGAHIDLSAGDWVGAYRILEELGQGGMGTVFLAEQREPVRRRVALKVIKLGMDTREVIARFEAERQALALLSHPNVAAVLDAGATESGRPYFVMEHVSGVPLTQYCDEHRLGVEARLNLFMQACEGIQHAHHKGIIHRDIKPGNVLVTEKDGKPLVKVIDFGIAKSTQQKLVAETIYTRLGVFVGTPNYTSPEQAKLTPADVDTRTDVYSLGVMLYELLVGQLPFEPGTFAGKPLDEIQRIINESDPPSPTVRFDSMGPARESVALKRGIDPQRLRRALKGDIAWIALKAMEKDRNRRYPSAFALAEDVRRFLAREPVVARPPSALYRFSRFARRHAIGVAVSAIALIGLVVTSAAMTGLYFKARDAEKLAQQEARAARQVAEFLTELFTVSDPNESRGRDLTARELLDRGAQRIRSELAEQPVVRANLMRTISSIQEELGLFEASAVLGREALDLHRAHLDPLDPDLSGSLNNMANIYESMGHYDESLDHYRQALAIDEAIHGSDHPAIAGALSDIGGVLETYGRYAEAVAHIERALAINRAAFGENNARVASDLNDLGNVFESQEEYHKALSYYRRALAINEAVLGPDHPDISGDLSDIGSVLVELGQYPEAVDLHQRALAVAEPAFGREHPDVAESLFGLAEAWVELERYEEAVHHLQRAHAIRLARFGAQHEETVETAHLLGTVYLETDRPEQAVPLFDQIRALGPDRYPEDFAEDDAELGAASASQGCQEEPCYGGDRGQTPHDDRAGRPVQQGGDYQP